MTDGFGSRLKADLLHGRIRYLTRKDWRKRFDKIFELHPEYGNKCDREVESAHVKLWRGLSPRINLDTLRVCCNISGRVEVEIIPEEIYTSEIEPCLNGRSEIGFMAHKSVYNRWYGGNIFPHVFLHGIDGNYFDSDYSKVGESQIDGILEKIDYPVVIKPNIDSFGGANVHFPRDSGELRGLVGMMKNFVVQERIAQNEFFDRFNRNGLNTLRVCLYRSVVTNEINILNVALRMGKGGSLDNETAGGIVTFINENGSLNDYAVDKYGGKFSSHPDTGLLFADAGVIPGFKEMKALAVRIASDVFMARIVSLDMCLDDKGDWRVIEINLLGQTIRFAQYAGRPFFGGFTGEVIDYCLKTRKWR